MDFAVFQGDLGVAHAGSQPVAAALAVGLLPPVDKGYRPRLRESVHAPDRYGLREMREQSVQKLMCHWRRSEEKCLNLLGDRDSFIQTVDPGVRAAEPCLDLPQLQPIHYGLQALGWLRLDHVTGGAGGQSVEDLLGVLRQVGGHGNPLHHLRDMSQEMGQVSVGVDNTSGSACGSGGKQDQGLGVFTAHGGVRVSPDRSRQLEHLHPFRARGCAPAER